jgi:hypothetical protein
MNLKTRIKSLELAVQRPSMDSRDDRLRRMCAEKAAELEARMAQEGKKR